MTGKEQYYWLDDVGFGNQKKVSKKKWKEIVKKTGEAIRALRAAEKLGHS